MYLQVSLCNPTNVLDLIFAHINTLHLFRMVLTISTSVAMRHHYAYARIFRFSTYLVSAVVNRESVHTEEVKENTFDGSSV